MTPTRRLLLRDVPSGLAAVVFAGGFVLGAAREHWWVAPLVAVAAVVWVAILFADDRDAIPERLAALADRPALLAGLAFLALAVVLPATLLWPVVTRAVLAVFLGLGLGQLGYRFVFGVLRPIPEPVLRRAREAET